MSRVNKTHNILQDLEKLISNLKDAETGQRGYLLTGKEDFLDDYNGASEAVLSLITSIERQTSDNALQHKNILTLKAITEKRLVLLNAVLDTNEVIGEVDTVGLQKGKKLMDQARLLVDDMQEWEATRMTQRMENLSRSSTYTPVLIVIACVLSILITAFFYIRIRRDFDERMALQRELEEKDKSISHRINVIQGIAERISAGDYKTRVKDEEKDGLGNLAYSLNRMAESLEASFDRLADNEWLQKGVAGVNDVMVGEKDLQMLTSNTLEFIVRYTDSHAGAFYLLEDPESLKLYGSYAYQNSTEKTQIKLGEGLIGQAALDGQDILIEEAPEELIRISYATGEIKPANIYVLPIFHENNLKGVIEIASITPYTEKDFEFVKSVAGNVGIAINSSENRRRLNELLEETQSQSEELQAQHSELENLNAELESQTQQLLSSEEELRVQQDELMHANQELEERTKLLEEKNHIISERNTEIKKTAEQLAESTRYKSEFMANMSHELRTPLNSILLLSRLLTENNEKNLTQEQIEYARVIQSSGNGLLTLIDEILNLSKIEAGKMELEYGEVRTAEIAEELNAVFQPMAKDKDIDFIIEIAKDTVDTFVTDKVRLIQILNNLLSNAFKFTAKGQVVLEIRGKDPIAFSVRDTGIGISEDQQQYIFEAFRQADGSTRRKYGGTGLGLSISRELSRLLSGEIELASTPGQGSTFTVRIPPYQPESTPVTHDEIIQEKIEQMHSPLPAEPSELLAPVIPDQVPDDRQQVDEDEKVVLIVEDDTDFANALVNYSRKLGYKAIVTVRGDQVMEDVLKYKPMAVLLDIVLPVKDGWQIMDEMKSNPETRHIPVHIMSALDAKRESLRKGAVDYISKPFAFSEMREVFSKLEDALTRDNRKVLIIEENAKHAEALSYFLSTFNIYSEITGNVNDCIGHLEKQEVNCVILHTDGKHADAYDILEVVKKKPELEDLPVIVFTGENLSKTEEKRIKGYADSIVVKTAQSYKRILDEVALFLHLIETRKSTSAKKNDGYGIFTEVLKGKKVLVADDDVRNIYSITKTLEQHKMTVISAIDGEDALKQINEHPDVDIVLMDIMMPKLDGYRAIELIRQNKKHRQLPILAITAKAMAGDREKCIQAGASDYISKPVDIDQLMSLLRVWLYDSQK